MWRAVSTYKRQYFFLQLEQYLVELDPEFCGIPIIPIKKNGVGVGATKLKKTDRLGPILRKSLFVQEIGSFEALETDNRVARFLVFFVPKMPIM
jgi:hypothetical protein